MWCSSLHFETLENCNISASNKDFSNEWFSLVFTAWRFAGIIAHQFIEISQFWRKCHFASDCSMYFSISIWTFCKLPQSIKRGTSSLSRSPTIIILLLLVAFLGCRSRQIEVTEECYYDQSRVSAHVHQLSLPVAHQVLSKLKACQPLSWQTPTLSLSAHTFTRLKRG